MELLLFLGLTGLMLWAVTMARRAAFWHGWTAGRLDTLQKFVAEGGEPDIDLAPAWARDTVLEDAARVVGSRPWMPPPIPDTPPRP